MSLRNRVFERRAGSERGAVVALFGVLLPVLGLLTMFAIDTAHWWDYSRNLQSRADAAALAAGLEYGNTCGTATPNAAAMAKVGEAAQLYSGPQSTSDLPYDYATAATDFAPTGYQNLPTLKAGTLDHFHVFINASGPWKSGQISANPAHWPGHSGTAQSFTHGSVCSASYADDQGGKAGPITDVWVTQDNVPQFFRLVDIHPSISAHARVELQQGNAGDLIRPIAVRDSTAGSLPSCVTVNFVRDDGTNTVIKTVTLTKDATGDPTIPSGVLWDNPAGDHAGVERDRAAGTRLWRRRRCVRRQHEQRSLVHQHLRSDGAGGRRGSKGHDRRDGSHEHHRAHERRDPHRYLHAGSVLLLAGLRCFSDGGRRLRSQFGVPQRIPDSGRYEYRRDIASRENVDDHKGRSGHHRGENVERSAGRELAIPSHRQHRCERCELRLLRTQGQ
jgi:Flp pilus assembly protein TadG